MLLGEMVAVLVFVHDSSVRNLIAGAMMEAIPNTGELLHG